MREILAVVNTRGPQETPPDDRQLAEAARGGDEHAFEILVRRHSGGMHRTVSRILRDEAEAWDVVQMALLKAWQQLGRYNPKWSFATWIYRIGTNLAIDVLRARSSRLRAHEKGMEHRLRIVGESRPSSEAASGSGNHIFQARKVLKAEIAARFPEYLPASRRNT